jgi:hypothetical protein
MRVKLVLGILAVILAASWLWAAGPMPDTLRVTFPFPVIVNSMTLPPGTYEFRRANETMPASYTIFDSNGKQLGFTTLARREEVGSAAATDVANRDEVVVDEIGGKYYLDTLYLQGENMGYRFLQADTMQAQVERAAKENKGQRIPIVVVRVK